MAIRPYVMVESKIIVTNHFVGWIYNPNNAVDVVWHHNKFAEDNFFADLGGFDPFGLDDFADFVKMHFFIEDGTEYTFSVMGADGDEISAFLGIIVALKAVGVVAAGGIGWHWRFLVVLALGVRPNAPTWLIQKNSGRWCFCGNWQGKVMPNFGANFCFDSKTEVINHTFVIIGAADHFPCKFAFVQCPV